MVVLTKKENLSQHSIVLTTYPMSENNEEIPGHYGGGMAAAENLAWRSAAIFGFPINSMISTIYK